MSRAIQRRGSRWAGRRSPRCAARTQPGQRRYPDNAGAASAAMSRLDVQEFHGAGAPHIARAGPQERSRAGQLFMRASKSDRPGTSSGRAAGTHVSRRCLRPLLASSSFGSVAAQAAPPDRRRPGGDPARVRRLKVRRAMQVLGTPLTVPNGSLARGRREPGSASLPGRFTHGRDLQILSQRVGGSGLWVSSTSTAPGTARAIPDGQRIEECVTNASVLQCVACRIDACWQQAREAELAADTVFSAAPRMVMEIV